jgi:hypothetical protein
MENTHQLTVPDWFFQIGLFLERNWTAILGILLVALLASVVTELAKHKFNLKFEEARAKKLVRWTLLVVTSGFTAIGYFIWFAQANTSLLKNLPYVGQAEVEVLGAAWYLYNFRLNKTFKNVTAKLASWSETKAVNPSLPQPATSLPETESNFESL